MENEYIAGIRGVLVISNPAFYEVFSKSSSFFESSELGCVFVLSSVIHACARVLEVEEIPVFSTSERRKRSVWFTQARADRASLN